MKTVEEVLAQDADQLQASWNEVDRIVRMLPTRQQQIHIWEQICVILDKAGSLKGHPFFRLGALQLMEDSDEQTRLKYLELAYIEDQKYADTTGTQAEGRAAYCRAPH